jgi:hypothetical protein
MSDMRSAEPSVLLELEESFSVILNVPSDLNAVLCCDDLLQSFPSLHNGLAGYVTIQ